MARLDRCGLTGKPCYPKKIAITVKNKARMRGAILREYWCKYCNWFHLTHKEDYHFKQQTKRKKYR